MATITAVTSSVIGEYLNVLDPNTWVGGVVPGPDDTAIFPHRTYTYYRSTATTNPAHDYYYHPILGPWSGSWYGMINKDGVSRSTKQVNIAASSTTTLNLPDNADSGSFLSTLYPFYGQNNMIKIDYDHKANTVFYTCSVDHTYKEWKNPPTSGVYTSSLNYDDNPAYGRFYYNTNYFLKNINQYQLTSSVTWSVGHIDMGNFTEFKIKDAKLELTSTTPYIDMSYGNYQKLHISGDAHLQISCSAGVNTGTTGIQSTNKSYQMIIISGSENFSSSFVASNSNEGDTVLTVANNNTFVEGDLISLSNQTNPKFLNRMSFNNRMTDYTNTNGYHFPKYYTSSYDSFWGGPDAIPINDDNPYGSFGFGQLSGSVMENEWALVATSSGPDLTIEKLLTDRGWVEEELGQYQYDQFVETFSQTPPQYNGTKTVVLLASHHRNYKTGDKIIINKKAYTLGFVGTHLKQDLLYDFSSGSGDLDPHDVFVWSPNEFSGSSYDYTNLQGSYYSWNEYYRKGTLWGSGSHSDINGKILSSGSFFLDPNKLRSWGAYGTPYNTYRYDTYQATDHHISGSYFIEGEIEVSASVTDDPFHNTYQEKRFDESGSRWQPYSAVWIEYPCNPHVRGSGLATFTQGNYVTTNTRANRSAGSWGFENAYYGLTFKNQSSTDGGLYMPLIRGNGNPHVSGSISATPQYSTLKAYPSYASMSNASEMVTNFTPPFNCTGSGESFSIKLTRQNNNNKFYYKDKGGETQMYSNYTNIVDHPSVRVALAKDARIYSISIKGRYQLAILDSTDTGFERLDEITRAGLIYNKDSSFKAEFIGSKIVDPMGYKNLLRDWDYKRGKSSIMPYIQGFTYNTSTYNNCVSYLADYYGGGKLFSPTDNGKAGEYFGYPWNNAGCHYTFDFGAPVTFDTIGLRVNYDTYGEGMRSAVQQGTGNYMTNIGIEYTLDGTTNFNDNNTGSFRITAPDPRQSTGRGNPIRFYTGSQEVTAQVIRIKNAGGSRGTQTVDLGFLGAYSGISGSTSRQIKLASTKHFQVGDLVYFYSNQLGPDGSCTNLSTNQVSYYNAFYPQYTTDYNLGNYFTDVEPRTVGGFRQEYELKAIDYDTNIVTLDRDPVHQHLEKDTLILKANRGTVKFDVAHYGRDRDGCNIRIGYGILGYKMLSNFYMPRGRVNLYGTTGHYSSLIVVRNAFMGSRFQGGIYGLYLTYDNVNAGFYHNIFSTAGMYQSTLGRGWAGKFAMFGGLFLASGTDGSIPYNHRQTPRENNFIIADGGYAHNYPMGYLSYYATTAGQFPTRNWKNANIYYTGYYELFENYGELNYGNLFQVMGAKSNFKNIYSHTYQKSRAQSHGFSYVSDIHLSKRNTIKSAPLCGFWKYPGSSTINWYGTRTANYDDYRKQMMPSLELNNPLFSGKDVVSYQGNNWSNYLTSMNIIQNSSNDYTLNWSPQYPYVQVGETGVGMHEIKTCEFYSNSNTQIRVKYSMDFKYYLSTLLGRGEQYETGQGYPIQNLRYGYAEDQNTRKFQFAVTEYNENNVLDKTIFSQTLEPISLTNYQNYTVDQIIDVKEGCTYRIALVWRLGRPNTYNYPIMDYKNPSFVLFTENKSNIVIINNNFNAEKLFTNPNYQFQLRMGGEGKNSEPNPTVQTTNISNPTKIIKINKIKL